MAKKKDESPPPVMRTDPTWQPGMSISAKPVLPALPESEEMQTELLDDLERMGCLGFTKVAWDIDHKSVLKELGMICAKQGANPFPDSDVRSRHRG